MSSNPVSDYLKSIGALGGKARSRRKTASCRANGRAGAIKRWAKRRKPEPA